MLLLCFLVLLLLIDLEKTRNNLIAECIMRKSIVFFDGDGTLWYPKQTKRKEKPHWIYKQKKSLNDYCEQLTLTPTTLSTLKALKKKEVILVLLSTHLHDPDEAQSILQHKVNYFHVENLFDEIHATRNTPTSKGDYITNILQQRNIVKKKALMVGDNYLWDYKPAQDSGIDAILMESDYRKEDPNGKRIRRVIRELKDILSYV